MNPLRYGCPCSQDCPRRVLGCRSNCEPFQAYEKRRMEGYAEADRRRKISEFQFEGKAKGRDRMVKKRNALLQQKRGGQTRFG